jgi:hypothetical protein
MADPNFVETCCAVQSPAQIEYRRKLLAEGRRQIEKRYSGPDGWRREQIDKELAEEARQEAEAADRFRRQRLEIERELAEWVD